MKNCQIVKAKLVGYFETRSAGKTETDSYVEFIIFKTENFPIDN